jgi:SAM-dependent methyltransferase
MTVVFSPDYADVYDAVYRDKDYAAECDLIERILRKYTLAPVHTILDLGCGTGNHTIPLALRGYDLCGVDMAQPMLERAQSKSAEAGLAHHIQFHLSRINDLELPRQFDVALMMFAVLGYQLENRDVTSALRAARKHLKPGGLLIFDVWYGPCVLRQGVSDRVKVVPTESGRIIRVAQSKLDSLRQTCIVHYQVWRTVGDRIVEQVQEDHSVRFFFPRELELLLSLSSFELLSLGTFPDIDRDPDDTTWNIMGVARAV